MAFIHASPATARFFEEALTAPGWAERAGTAAG
jgi:hypothetical protein